MSPKLLSGIWQTTAIWVLILHNLPPPPPQLYSLHKPFLCVSLRSSLLLTAGLVARCFSELLLPLHSFFVYTVLNWASVFCSRKHTAMVRMCNSAERLALSWLCCLGRWAQLQEMGWVLDGYTWPAVSTFILCFWVTMRQPWLHVPTSTRNFGRIFPETWNQASVDGVLGYCEHLWVTSVRCSVQPMRK